MCVGLSPPCMTDCAPHDRERSPEDHGTSPGAGFRGSCEPPWECWELDLCTLEQQSVLLTAETSVHSLKLAYYYEYVRLKTNSRD